MHVTPEALEILIQVDHLRGFLSPLGKFPALLAFLSRHSLLNL